MSDYAFAVTENRFATRPDLWCRLHILCAWMVWHLDVARTIHHLLPFSEVDASRDLIRLLLSHQRGDQGQTEIDCRAGAA